MKDTSRIKMLFAVILLCTSAVFVELNIFGRSQTMLFVYIAAILLFYIYSVYVIFHELETRKNDQFGAVLAYLGMSALIITTFATIWQSFDLFEPSSTSIKFDKDSFLDAMYFSASVFSTVGFGDFTPKPQLGRLVSIIEILLSGVHTVTYFSLILRKIDSDSSKS